ncbi:MAG: helix-turn-helix domain-containing protein [Deltaproteobacteria bacterium]|nr:helix-turn-helix domain-containing protein [Deltaproteobacteria bacterium]
MSNGLPNLYELLELTPVAGRSEIIDALRRLRYLYSPESEATYTLFSDDERQRTLMELDQAEFHLLDTERRTRYDREVLGIGGTRHELPVPAHLQAAPAALETSRQPIGFRPPAAEAAATPLPRPAVPVQTVASISSLPPPPRPQPVVAAPAPAAPANQPDPVARPVAMRPAPVKPASVIPHNTAPVPANAPAKNRPDPASFFNEANDYTGKNLRRYREATGFSIRELAAITRISPQHLENIEGDEFGMLPAPVYLKGFLKSYCRVVGLNPQPVIDGYLNHVRIFMELHR